MTHLSPNLLHPQRLPLAPSIYNTCIGSHLLQVSSSYHTGTHTSVTYALQTFSVSRWDSCSAKHQHAPPDRQALSVPSWLMHLNSSSTENVTINQKGNEDSDFLLTPPSGFFFHTSSVLSKHYYFHSKRQRSLGCECADRPQSFNPLVPELPHL